MPSRRWVLLGVVAGLVLCLLDLGGGFLVDRRSANISGTLALSPVLTGLGGSRRQTVAVGALAVAAAGALVLADGVPVVPGVVRTVVVAAAAALAVVAVGVRNAQLATLQDRRQAARTLQAAMLTRLPEPDHLQLTSRYLPASSGDQVGGDWYDALVDADGCTVLVIGDVTGHDIHAAAAMGQLRGLLRSYAVEGGQSPAQVLRRVDAAVERLGLEVLATAVVARVEQDEDERRTGARRLTWSNAGHPAPLLLTPADGGRAARTRFLDEHPDLMLGVLPEADRTDRTVPLPPSATLLLYTDGLVERRDQSLTDGLADLGRAAEQAAAADLDAFVEAVLEARLGGAHQDDVAVLALRAHPEDRPRPAVAGPGRSRPGPPEPELG
ncbi:SpoIIE family protein phosphatase [Kineococcus sp. T13]|nr:SpoIIE family protein phosphatase [Kineococcus vitellinus]